jgi:hypothetical protein
MDCVDGTGQKKSKYTTPVYLENIIKDYAGLSRIEFTLE